MTHIRTTVRNQIKTVLTGLVTTGNNVFGPEKQTYEESEIPCLIVYTSAEPVDPDAGNATVAIHRDLDVVIIGKVKMRGDVDAQLDTISGEVEEAMALIQDMPVDYLGMEKDFDSGLEKPIGTIEMNYRIKYLTRWGLPESMF